VPRPTAGAAAAAASGLLRLTKTTPLAGVDDAPPDGLVDDRAKAIALRTGVGPLDAGHLATLRQARRVTFARRPPTRG